MRFLFFLLFICLAACTQQNSKEANSFTLTDDLGRRLPLQTRPKKVMALAPSLTEMLALVVPENQIIARTHQCNYPDWVKSKPVVNTYPLDVERILQLKPDLIFTSEGMTSLEEAAKLQELGIPVYYQQYLVVEDVFKGLEEIGEIMNRQERGRQVADSLRKELARTQLTEWETIQKVIALAWQDPILVYGRNTLFTDKIKLAGGVNAIDTAFSNPYPPITREHLLKLNPDVIISRNYDFAAMDTTFFRMYPELRALKAYQTKRIFAVDPDLMERPSPRVVESVKELQALLSK